MRPSLAAIAIPCLVSLLAGCRPVADEASNVAPVDPRQEAVHAAIAKAWFDHIEAAKRKDLKAVTQIYTDDVFYSVPGTEVRGRTAIDEMEARSLVGADVLNAVHETEGLSVYGDVAYELGTVVGPIRERGRSAVTVRFHFMAIWHRQADGEWRIKHFVGSPE